MAPSVCILCLEREQNFPVTVELVVPSMGSVIWFCKYIPVICIGVLQVYEIKSSDPWGILCIVQPWTKS